ncbi:MAG: C40 family peptidase [Clostridiales bacterium]|nr:C40 family peptidase [Clostridiales bacterium]
MKYEVRKSLAFVTGLALSLNILSVDDIGAVNDVSLQAPEMEITSAEPMNFVPASSFVSTATITDEVTGGTDDLDERTFTILVDDVDNPEIMNPSEFIHDGSHFWLNVDLANLREEPSVESDIVGQISYSTEVIRVSYGTEWSFIRLDNGTEGYVLSSLLSEEEIALPTATPTPSPTPVPTATPTPVPVATSTPTPAPTTAPAASVSETPYNATVYASCVMNVRSGPGTEYSLITGLNPGDAITVTASTDNGWYRTADGYYVKADLCLDTAPTQPAPASSAPIDTSGYSDFAAYCLQYLGVPYVYSGASPSGFDCSGFVSYVFANYYGVSLPHNAADIAELGAPVSAENIACGDVICHDYNSDGYIDHVSIYIGNGTCIHASNSRVGVVTASWPMGAVVSIRRFV